MRESLFIDRLREVVRDHGNRPALVVDGKVTHTHRQLWEAAEQVAAHLQSKRVGRESLVGIELPRSAEFIVAMVGVWRAGAAYLPLDPTLPASRRNFMIEDSGAHLAATNIGELVNHDNRPLDPPTLSEADLAYVIYTSGTTGQPKGVAVEQRGLVGLFDAQIEAFQLGPDSRVFFLLSTSFDASVSDIGTALLSGAALCIESKYPTQGIEPAILGDLLCERRITHIDIPPALLAMMDDQPPPTLRTIVIGGEPCRIDVVRRWARQCRVVNVYGPTEATVCTSLVVCDPDTWDRPLLGQPIRGIEYRVDYRGQTEDGELLIGGRGLARGYVNDEKLTNSRFVVKVGRRWYRTGDLVRYDADGEYVFLGRIDRQVKLRGNRIEPEEIETVLSSAPGVVRSAVLVRPVSASSSRQILVAFVVASEGFTDAASLREYLAQSLPVWMIPQRIEFTDALPLTTSGKVDLERLKSIPLGTPAAPEAASPLERQLAEVWEAALGVACGMEDDFFVLGGDSLAMLDIVALSAARGIDIDPALIASERTIRKICARRQVRHETHLAVARTAESLRDDIRQDVAELHELAARLPTPRAASQPHKRQILLTGATGFLGCRVLEELLRRTDCRIICLVRGRNEDDAWNRLRNTVLDQQLKIGDSDWARVDVANGDLTVCDCGLVRKDWNRLAETTEAIFHCAARVQLLEEYDQLRPANVVGLTRMLRLCLSGIPKQIHYASTLSVFVGTDRDCEQFVESDDLSMTNTVYGGYAQSKWAAEVLLRDVGLSPESWTAFRFGLLAIDSRTGILPEHDLLTSAIRGLVNLGCVPTSVPDISFDVTPVDFAAQAMVQLAALPPSQRRSSTYHIANSQSVTFRQLIRCLKRVRPELKEFERRAFLQRVADSADSLQATAYLALSRWLVPQNDSPSHRQLDLFQATGVVFDTRHASQDLQNSSILCPPADDHLVTFLLRRILT